MVRKKFSFTDHIFVLANIVKARISLHIFWYVGGGRTRVQLVSQIVKVNAVFVAHRRRLWRAPIMFIVWKVILGVAGLAVPACLVVVVRIRFWMPMIGRWWLVDLNESIVLIGRMKRRKYIHFVPLHSTSIGQIRRGTWQKINNFIRNNSQNIEFSETTLLNVCFHSYFWAHRWYPCCYDAWECLSSCRRMPRRHHSMLQMYSLLWLYFLVWFRQNKNFKFLCFRKKMSALYLSLSFSFSVSIYDAFFLGLKYKNNKFEILKQTIFDIISKN